MSCREVANVFMSCGGDLVGTWSLVSVCKENQIGEELDCPGFEGDLTRSYSEGYSATFDGNKVSIAAATVTNGHDVTIPLVCLSQLEMEADSCAELSGPETGTCTGDDVCRCQDEATEALPARTLDYHFDENGALIVEGDKDHHYCVQGQSLYLEGHGLGEGGDGDSYIYRFARQ